MTPLSPPLDILLVGADAPAASAGRTLLEAAPYAVNVQSIASFDMERLPGTDSTPEVVVVDSRGANVSLTRLLPFLQHRYAPMPAVLVLVPSHHATSAPPEVVVFPDSAPHPLILHRMIFELGKTCRLTKTLAEVRTGERALRDELDRLGRQHAADQRRRQDLSHDLRSPLNALIGYGEMLSEELAAQALPDLQQDAHRLLELGRKMLAVVETLDDSGPEPSQPMYALGTPDSSAGGRSAATELLLLIDDDDDLRELMAQYLQTEGFDVRTAADGEEGLRMARLLRPAAITLDVEMPGMDGWEVLSRLKHDPMLETTPVVMLTGRGNEQRAAQALRQGADGYLMKGSITAPAIRQTIAGVLEKTRRRTEPSE